jgi:hypothetical protein
MKAFRISIELSATETPYWNRQVGHKTANNEQKEKRESSHLEIVREISRVWLIIKASTSTTTGTCQ